MLSSTHSRLVAVIDDDDGFAASLLALLEAEGYQATRFASAEAFFADDGNYNCLFVDWVLPGMSGELLCRRVAREREGTELTLMSGERRCESLSEPLPPSVSFLGKPFDPDALLDSMVAPAPAPLPAR